MIFTKDNKIHWIEKLKSSKIEERESSLQILSDQRSEILNQLSDIIEKWEKTNKSDTIEVNSTIHFAFRAIGILKASEMASLIVRFIKISLADIDRSPGAEALARFDAPFVALLELEVVAWEPADCELCAAGEPLTAPGSRP